MDKPTIDDVPPSLLKDLDQIIIFTDGSGTTRLKECGFGVVVYTSHGSKYLDFLGGHLSNGTNNFAELIPIVHSLWFLVSLYGEAIKKYHITIVSDSEITIKSGKKEYVRSNPLWGSIEKIEQLVNLNWWWIPRNSNKISEYCDYIAGKYRKLEF